MTDSDRSDALSAFLEQWDFLQSSMLAYDAGKQHEAKRLATTTRVLVHDHGGTSVLTQLGAKASLRWFSSNRVNPRNLLHSHALVSVRLAGIEDGMEASYEPRSRADMEQLPFGRWVDFDTWWTEDVIKDVDGRTYSRNDLVLMLANRAGGAHVGPLKPAERTLVSGKRIAWSITVGDVTEPMEMNPVPASMRTIANELDLTFESQLTELGLTAGGQEPTK